MDIEAIYNAIDELENSDTTVENVSELASLYIVKQNLLSKITTDTEKELNDILPNYRIYVDIKRKYQLGQTSESDVIHSIKTVCKELQEFLCTLYCSTDMNKERLCIRSMLCAVTEKISK